jgi:CheY-like chemotaxis protein
VKFTSNQDEVIALVKSFKPALVLVDILQKEVIEEIKTDQETAAIPVILMTGHTLREATPEANVDDMIEKPFNPYLLEKKIGAQLFK